MYTRSPKLPSKQISKYDSKTTYRVNEIKMQLEIRGITNEE